MRILKALLRQGEVDFKGRYYQARARIPAPVDVPVMASALGPKAYELCGAEFDGAISWVVPGVYMRDVALPAITAGAERAGRPTPPLVAHAPVCVHENPDEIRAAVRQRFGSFARSRFYQKMFIAAGFPEMAEGSWSDALIDAVVLWGSNDRVAERLERLLAWGVTEVLASPVPAGSDRRASLERTLGLLAKVSQQLSA